MIKAEPDWMLYEVSGNGKDTSSDNSEHKNVARIVSRRRGVSSNDSDDGTRNEIPRELHLN